MFTQINNRELNLEIHLRNIEVNFFFIISLLASLYIRFLTARK